jgi:hypothetical protein
VVFYSSLAAREEVLETVRLVAPEEWQFVETASVEDAFSHPGAPLLLTPEDEAAAVETLDGRRDALVDRTAPAILFLLKGGSGERALRGAPGLASWLRNQEFDPEPPDMDLQAERARFETLVGQPLEGWLNAWRRGKIPDTLENNLRYQRALLLEEEP